MMKKHYSPGIPVLINQKKNDGKSAFIYLGNKYKNKKNNRGFENPHLNYISINMQKYSRAQVQRK